MLYRQFRICITALQATLASGKAPTPILLCIIHHSANELDFRKCILRFPRNPLDLELYAHRMRSETIFL